METEEIDKLDRQVRNTKVLVNWKDRLVISTMASNTSAKYRELIKLGYVQVGEFKQVRQSFYWDDKFFNHDHKVLI